MKTTIMNIPIGMNIILLLFSSISVTMATVYEGGFVSSSGFRSTVATHATTKQIVIIWPSVKIGEGASAQIVPQYNIYRKNDPNGIYKPIDPNPNPITIVGQSDFVSVHTLQ